LSISLMKRLKNEVHENIAFIYVIPDIGHYDYYSEMIDLIAENNLKDNFYFYTKPVAYPAVIKLCDLFIRPTNTDGDALSIRESLLLRTPVIASDVCNRPKGTILFNNRNSDDLYDKVVHVRENYEKEMKNIENIEFEDNAMKIIDVYREVLNI